jgi:cold shock CspA family protein
MMKMTGTIAFFSPKLWGFISPKDTSQPDVFFHVTALTNLSRRDLIEGLLVEYEIGTRNNKPVALSVRRPNAEEAK